MNWKLLLISFKSNPSPTGILLYRYLYFWKLLLIFCEKENNCLLTKWSFVFLSLKMVKNDSIDSWRLTSHFYGFMVILGVIYYSSHFKTIHTLFSVSDGLWCRLFVLVCLAASAAGQGFRKKGNSASGSSTPPTVQKQVAAGVSSYRSETGGSWGKFLPFRNRWQLG